MSELLEGVGLKLSRSEVRDSSDAAAVKQLNCHLDEPMKVFT